MNHKDFKLVEGYKEITGEGIEGYVDNDLVKNSVHKVKFMTARDMIVEITKK